MPGPRADQLSQDGANPGDVVTAGAQFPSFEPPTAGWRLLHTAVFSLISGDVDADTDPPDINGDFQAWDFVTSLVGTSEVHIFYEGRLAPTETAITEIQIPIKGTGQFKLRLYVEGATSVHLSYDSGTLSAPASRTVYMLTNGTDFTDQPVGEGRYFVVIETTVDVTETVYAGRPFVNHT